MIDSAYVITLEAAPVMIGRPARAKTWSPPQHAIDWYTRNCCPACGRVNNNGVWCATVHRCMCCGTVVCANSTGWCPVCHGVLDGYSGSAKAYDRWLTSYRRKQARTTNGANGRHRKRE